ncbi:hypothetical protein COEREDRAFT_79042 [Coemansia reversa NRRL 1564]|uniref:Uncharacterized protein n=1 Tax=Coemansia reversa (strain ATCC 12441 / NRRL 1564) TaxID=763665 RepID=A0A2G5BM89_COERN|nr:hypothetical protein COEREDRAFT_79042 [Coemansia reversa NRRL 1564]|eukprot:PIA19767.1 hypothetical protein COEREDRAFT_79042 [Coemansia reversa NRRL 1564]
MQVRQALGYVMGMALAASANAHVSLKSPCVRYTPFCDSCPEIPSGQALDQNINAPIGTHDSISQPLCKFTTPYSRPAVEWTAGTTVDVEFRDHAAVHGGGHCQFALSYDGGKTFVVIHDELRYCFVGGPSSSNTAAQLSYSIPLPADLPSGDKVVFAWAWNNAIGNREFYMNCADVAIKGSGSSFSGPEMLVANYGPDSPFIPEFNGDYETAIDLYNARKTITVSGSGGGIGPVAPGNNTTSPGVYSAVDDSIVPGSPTDVGVNPSGGYSAPGMGSVPGSPEAGSPDAATGADTPLVPDTFDDTGSFGYASGPDGQTVPTSTAPAYNGVTPPSPFYTTPVDSPAAGGYAATSVPAAPPVYHARMAAIPAPAPPPAHTTSKCA